MRPVLRSLMFFRHERLLIAGWLGIIVLSVLLGLLQAWPTAVLVDAVLTRDPHSGFFHRIFLYFLPNDMLMQVIGVTLIGMAMKITQDGLQWCRRVISKRIEVNSIRRARSMLYHKLQELGPAYQKTQPAGDSVYRVSNDVSGLAIVLNVLVDAGVAVMTLAVMCAIMLTRSVPLTIFALSVLPMLLLANAYFAPRVRDATTMAKQAEAALNNSLIRSISSISLVQLFGRSRYEADRFNRSAEECADGWQSLNKAESWYGFTVQTIFSLGGAIIFGYGGYLVWRDQFANPVPNGFTVGDIMVFMAYLGGMWDPLSRITGMAVHVKPGIVGAERLYAVLDIPLKTAECADPYKLAPAPRDVMLDDVSFKYETGASTALTGVNLTIRAGQMVAFVGESGSGKSTLLNLLPRFYDTTRGAILLSGVDVRDIKLADLRGHFAFASQDTVMLPGSVADNIAYSSPEATREQIEAAARRAGAEAFIRELPHGYDTDVGENGGLLSGGQRQRIAIARALLSDAPILVLDEPTSALDAHHEAVVMKSIEEERKRRTVILVTHRLAAARTCDRIFVLEHGRVVESGTHDELARAGGAYQRLLDLQATDGNCSHGG